MMKCVEVRAAVRVWELTIGHQHGKPPMQYHLKVRTLLRDDDRLSDAVGAALDDIEIYQESTNPRH